MLKKKVTTKKKGKRRKKRQERKLKQGLIPEKKMATYSANAGKNRPSPRRPKKNNSKGKEKDTPTEKKTKEK